MAIDIALVGGMVYDGEGTPPVKAHVGVSDGRIVYPLEPGDAKTARRKIDVTGLAVAPGFINIHSHSEIPFIIDGRIPSSLYQGITTEVVGNCGFSAAPMLGDYRIEHEKDLLRDENIVVDWWDFNDFFKRIRKNGSSINMITLIGQGTLRGSVVGMDDRPATAEEMERMKELTVELMNQGAWGISTGLIYPPSSYSDTDELVELVKMAAKMGGFYSSHIRGEGDHLLDSVNEALEIGKRAEIPVEISHLKAAGRPNWGKIDKVLEMIGEAREQGLIVQHDQYPYTMSSTGLAMVAPGWALDGGNEKFLARIRDRETRKKMIEDMKKDLYANGDTIIISGVNREENKIFQGRKVDEIAREMGKTATDFILDLLASEEASVGAIYMSMCEEDVRRVMKDPYTSICTDAWPGAADGPLHKGKPHPRTYGSFPRVISHYVRDEKLFSISEAIRKMTTLPARMLGLKNRGRISDGFAADLTIFDPKKIKDTSTIQDPHRYAEGIEYLIVNGQMAMEKGKILSYRPGKVLRRFGEGI